MITLGREQSLRLAITISGGTGTGTITPLWTISRWIRIAPVAETDTYDITIADAEGLIMATRVGQLGAFSERLEMSLGIIRTVTIANATQNGTYQCRFDCH